MGKKAAANRPPQPIKGKGKKKELELPAPNVGRTNQTAPPNQACAWKRCSASESQIQRFVEAGLLQSKDLIGWRSGEKDAWPFETNPAETVSFLPFHERGLGLPTSDFFRGLLEYYGLQLIHLNPNGIFQVSIYVHFCEAFLGIKPHFQFFRKLFRLKPQPGRQNMFVVGAAGFQLRQNMSSLYFDYDTPSSNTDWREKWFYIDNHEPKLPKVTGHRPEWSTRWKDEPSHGDSLQIPELMERLKNLKSEGLTAEGIAYSFIKRRIQPLQKRERFGFEYQGTQDNDRMSSEELTSDEVMFRLRRLFGGHLLIPQIVREFSASNPPKPVSTRDDSPRVLLGSRVVEITCRVNSPQEDVALYESTPPLPEKDKTPKAAQPGIKISDMQDQGEEDEEETESEELEDFSSGEEEEGDVGASTSKYSLKRSVPESSRELPEDVPKRRRTEMKRSARQQIIPIDVPPQVITLEMGETSECEEFIVNPNTLKMQVVGASAQSGSSAAASAPPSTEVATTAAAEVPPAEAEVAAVVPPEPSEVTIAVPASTNQPGLDVPGVVDVGTSGGQSTSPSVPGLRFKPFSFARVPKLKVTRSQR